MTEYYSPSPFASGRYYHETFVYNAWKFKTLELEEVRYILPLN